MPAEPPPFLKKPGPAYHLQPRTLATSLNVLFVDDQKCIRQLMRELLRSAGLRAETAEDARDALAKFKAGQWDLVFTDYAMPGMNGEELAQELKKINPALPVIMVTGYTDVALNRGVIDSVVEKPLTREKLCAAMWHALLERTRPTRGQTPNDDTGGAAHGN
jgi:DNA-binding NtrC family response regulator